MHLHILLYMYGVPTYMGYIGGPLRLPLPSLLEGQKGLQCLQIRIHECEVLLYILLNLHTYVGHGYNYIMLYIKWLLAWQLCRAKMEVHTI